MDVEKEPADAAPAENLIRADGSRRMGGMLRVLA